MDSLADLSKKQFGVLIRKFHQELLPKKCYYVRCNSIEMDELKGHKKQLRKDEWKKFTANVNKFAFEDFGVRDIFQYQEIGSSKESVGGSIFGLVRKRRAQTFVFVPRAQALPAQMAPMSPNSPQRLEEHVAQLGDEEQRVNEGLPQQHLDSLATAIRKRFEFKRPISMCRVWLCNYLGEPLTEEEIMQLARGFGEVTKVKVYDMWKPACVRVRKAYIDFADLGGATSLLENCVEEEFCRQKLRVRKDIFRFPIALLADGKY